MKKAENLKENEEMTLSAFARETGKDRRAIERQLLAAGVSPVRTEGRAKFYRRIDFLSATQAAGDSKSWSVELAKFKALRERHAYEKEKGTLVEFEEAMDIMREAILPVRQFLLGLASTLSARCNPSDPEHARAAIEAAVEQGMRMLADGEKAKIKRREDAAK